MDILSQSAVPEISGVRETKIWRRAWALWVTPNGNYHNQKGITVNMPGEAENMKMKKRERE